jgi:hypothetical protein
MSHEKPVEPFADLHCEEGHIRATLLHDPTVEGLDMAIYMDGSGSMMDEYRYKGIGKSMWHWLFGGNKPAPELTNEVEPQVQWMLEYLATKDRNGVLRVAYWACGKGGQQIEHVGDLLGIDVKTYKFPGPKEFGDYTYLKPALEDYVRYMRKQSREGAKRGCAVFVTDGELHDAEEVKEFSERVAKEIWNNNLPPLNFILVGVGKGVNEEQMEDICHEEYPGIGHLWCHRIAEEITEVAELVAVLVDENMTVAAGGTIYDDRGNVVKRYESRLPAVLEFKVPHTSRSFTLEINGQRFTQPLPEDDDDDHH